MKNMIKAKRTAYWGLVTFIILSVLISSCETEEKKTFPLSVLIFYSIDDSQVAFQALTHSATSWYWDFGDGTTSDEQNPVHIYAEGGYYDVVLVASDGSGNLETVEERVGVKITPYVLLTGGATAAGGKTWKMSAAHGDNGDYFANADADLTVFDEDITPLPTGVFDLYLQYGDIYQDEFTFFYDGNYDMDLKDDGGALSGLVYQYLTNGGVDIIALSGLGEDFGLCIASYTPDANATFTYAENEDFSIKSVYGEGGILTYSGVTTLSFSGTEFVGFIDFERKVIIKEISEDKMTFVMFMAASPDYSGYNTHGLVLTFEVVK